MAYSHLRATGTGPVQGKQWDLILVPVLDQYEHFYMVLYFSFGPCTGPWRNMPNDVLCNARGIHIRIHHLFMPLMCTGKWESIRMLHQSRSHAVRIYHYSHISMQFKVALQNKFQFVSFLGPRQTHRIAIPTLDIYMWE